MSLLDNPCRVFLKGAKEPQDIYISSKTPAPNGSGGLFFRFRGREVGIEGIINDPALGESICPWGGQIRNKVMENELSYRGLLAIQMLLDKQGYSKDKPSNLYDHGCM